MSFTLRKQKTKHTQNFNYPVKKMTDIQRAHKKTKQPHGLPGTRFQILKLAVVINVLQEVQVVSGNCGFQSQGDSLILNKLREARDGHVGQHQREPASGGAVLP
jgi:hypothetical protein